MTPLWLKAWPKDSRKRNRYTDSIFQRVAPRYDRLTRLLSLGQDVQWKRLIVSLLPPESDETRILDLATGTADFPILLRRAGRSATIVGMDRSGAMLERAKEKCAGLERVSFARGDLNALPLAPNSFDVVLLGYGLRYLDDLRSAMASIHGALRPGGVFLSLDFGLPPSRTFRGVCLSYLFAVGTLWGIVLHGRLDTYWHIVESLRAYPGQGALGRAMEEAGFGRVMIAEQMGGISVLARAEKTSAALDQRSVAPRSFRST
jgi:demethylmenaquinone methyltransferase/2-methoxy-6-polyprenyl-1,4-benzoquinol methylase